MAILVFATDVLGLWLEVKMFHRLMVPCWWWCSGKAAGLLGDKASLGECLSGYGLEGLEPSLTSWLPSEP